MSLDNHDDFRTLYPRIYDVGLLDPRLLDGNSIDFTKNILMGMFGFYSLFSGPSTDWITEVDPHNSYRLNSYGYRDAEYTGPVDIIAAGCSQTFGQGVPEQWRWSNLLGEKLNMSVATVALPGWSAMGAINGVMSYILNYGKPKIVALYLPDFFRFDYVRNPRILFDDVDVDVSEREDPEYRIDIGHSMHVKKLPRISKRPHRTEHVINPESTVFFNGQILKFFLEYCKEADIEVVWSSWDGAVKELVDYIKNIKFNAETEKPRGIIDFSGYVDIDYAHDGKDTLDEYSLKNCHQKEKQELDPSVQRYYDYASDRDMHVGIHVHLHIADAFYERLHRLEA